MSSQYILPVQPNEVAEKQKPYSQETVDEICSRIASGESLRQICLLPNMPGKSLFFKWLLSDESLRDQYARAKEAQADAFNEEILDIADDSRNDWVERENERTGQTFIAINTEALARSKLRYEARRWLMGKMKPKKYGESKNVEVNHTGAVMHLTADVSATLQFLRDAIENGSTEGASDIQDAVSDRPVLAAPVRTE